MATRKESTLRAQWLGAQLKELRTAAGMTLDEAGEYLQRNPGTVSRFESAEYPIRRGDLLALLDLYGVSQGRERKDLMRLAEDVWQKGWWDGYADVVDQRFIDYPWLETRAERICVYSAMLVPGQMQTRDYAEAVIRNAAEPGTSEEQIDRWITFRTQRQRVLDDAGATQLSVVLDESTLHRQIGGSTIFHNQLRHLVQVSQRPNIEVRVLPFSVGTHPGLDGTFDLFRMPAPYPDVALVDSLAGNVFVESPGSERFVRAYDRLVAMSASPKQSVKLISAAMEE
ncbi:MAG TPA: helix-turn-helix transcriptional regulator [Mycobacteriales bacterium]|jgi:Helix-turn-helix.